MKGACDLCLQVKEVEIYTSDMMLERLRLCDPCAIETGELS